MGQPGPELMTHVQTFTFADPSQREAAASASGSGGFARGESVTASIEHLAGSVVQSFCWPVNEHVVAAVVRR